MLKDEKGSQGKATIQRKAAGGTRGSTTGSFRVGKMRGVRRDDCWSTHLQYIKEMKEGGEMT